MKNSYKLLLISSLFILAGVLAFMPISTKAEIMTNYYVSPVGSDENDGTEAMPFATLEKARDVIREISGPWTGDVYVWLRGGTYVRTETLEFTDEDSGKDGYAVFYIAYPGEKPVIRGGVQLAGWTSYQGGIYKATCPAEMKEFRQLYVNSKRAIRGRMPNINDYYRVYQWRTSDQTVRVDASDLKESWQNMGNGKVEMILQQYWAESIMRIASVTSSGAYKDIAPKPTEKDIVFGREWPQKSPQQAYHYENSLSFVDQEGEWYLDDNTSPHTVYYMPRSGEDLSKDIVIAPTIDTLVSIIGPNGDDKVNHMVFEGITFECSNWTRPNEEGNIGLQSQQFSIGDNQCDRPAAGVFVQNAQYVNFIRNTFRNMGSVGLDVYTGTNHVTVEGNVFRDIAGNGMQVGKFTEKGTVIAVTYNPSDPREYCEEIRIANNYIFKTAQDYYCGNGIAAGYIRFSTIAHNEIKDLPYTGISLGWGWTKNPCALTDNNIEYNRIYDVMKLLCDGGGIYTLGYSPNSYIRYNFIQGIVKSTWATTSYTTTYPLACVYFDQGSKGYTIEQNVLRNAHNNNYINDGLGTAGDNIKGTNYQSNATIEANAGIEPAFRDIKKNDDWVLSVPTQRESSDLYQVYPTIVHDQLTIDVRRDVPTSLRVSLFSVANGSNVKQVDFEKVKPGTSTLNVATGDLNAGVYIYIIRSEKHIVTGKFVVL